MHKIKTLGVAVVAVLAMSAVVASAAQASHFTATKYPAIITGEQEEKGAGIENFFEVNAGKVAKTECEIAKFKGTLAAASETLSMAPTYEKCSTTLGTAATIDTEGCTYLFHAGAVIAGTGEDSWSGTVDIVCPAGKKIKVTAPSGAIGCTIEIGSQNGLGAITYTNITTAKPEDVTVDVNVEKIAYNVVNNFACPLTTGNFANGKYVSKVTVTGKEDLAGERG